MGSGGGARGISGVAVRGLEGAIDHTRKAAAAALSHTPAHTDTQHRGPVVQLVARPCEGTPAHLRSRR